MFVLIAGGGRTGTQLANLLKAQDHKVLVIEHRPEILTRLHRDLPTEVVFEGIPTDPDVLERAGIRSANVVAACTAEDEQNLVICYMAKTRYQVTRTIARVNDPRHAWLFNETFKVDVSLNNSAVMASLIEEEMSLGDMMTLVKLRRGEFSVVEEKIPAGAPAVGIALKDLNLNENSSVAAIIRQGKVMVPRGSTVFEVGDEVLAVTGHEGLERLKVLFSSPPK